MDKKQDKLSELKKFHSEVLEYCMLSSRRLNNGSVEGTNYFSLHSKIKYKAGSLKALINELSDTKNTIVINGEQCDRWMTALQLLPINQESLRVIQLCATATGMAIGKLEDDIQKGKRDKITGELIEKKASTSNEGVRPLKSRPPKAFIAHEGETKALDKLKDFLDALGVAYLIAEKEPSNGRQVESQVNWTKGQADFAIILATKGKTISKKSGKPQMGSNVADEFGGAREVFENRIILLIEHGVQPHSNISGIVHERFAPQSMDKAFTKVVRELKNWGYIKSYIEQ